MTNKFIIAQVSYNRSLVLLGLPLGTETIKVPIETRKQCTGSATHPENNDVYSSNDSGKMTWQGCSFRKMLLIQLVRHH